ncbi:Cell number regulator 6 [Hordeum vulgare]|nr:Cell number regulator 6 [Hordeum vulgare]
MKVCANLLQPRHKERVVKYGLGCVFDLKIDLNISRPLMGHIYTKIDPSTMILDMGDSNKKLRITSDAIHHLFGFPQGDCAPPRPSEDGFDDAVMRLKAKLGYKRSDGINTKDLWNILKHLVKDDKNDDLALHVFCMILFMKVFIPSTSTWVSRKATMAENLVSLDMAQMYYCQLLVDDLRGVVIRYQ